LAPNSLVVEGVKVGSPAEIYGIRPGMKVLGINDTMLTDAYLLSSMMDSHPTPYQLTLGDAISPKVNYVSVGPLIAEATRRIQKQISLGSMTHLSLI